MKNEQTSVRGIPAWLDGRTVALIGTVCTVGLGVAATNLASTSALRSDMNARFNGVDERFNSVDERFNSVDERIAGVEASLNARIDATRLELGHRIDGLDSRLRAVEVGVAEIRGHLGLHGTHPVEDETPQHPADAGQGRDEERHQ